MPAPSATSSPGSDTRAVSEQTAASTTRKSSDVNAACMAAAIELEKTRALTEALESENSLLKDRLASEKQMVSLLSEVATTRAAEAAALRSAIDAKNETIKAKDAVITAQDDLVNALKTKRPSPWRRIGDILIGAAAIAVLK